MAKFNEQFIGQYSLSKTLRFELKPIGKTAENIKVNGFLEHDNQRADNYVLVKQLLDDYYRFYIEEALNGKELDADLIGKAYSAYNEGNTKESETINKKLRKQVADFFGSKEEYGLKDYKNLLKLQEKDGTPSKLVAWINQNNAYDEQKKEEYIGAVTGFEGFVTYFVGYKDNRENMFSPEDKATAISNRTVNENMYRFFDNVTNFAKIKKDYPDLYSQLANVEQYFVPSAFGKILSQSAINNYNQGVIGRTEQDVDAKGVNSVINEYRQKHGIKARDLHTMTVLYKQILSDRQTVFIETIKDNAEAIKLTHDNYQKLTDLAEEIKQLVSENITKDNLTTIYLRELELTNISNTIFGRWGVIHDALNLKLQQLKEKDAKLLKQKFEKVVCVKDICDIVEEYKTADDEAAEWKQQDIQNLFVNYFVACPDFATDFTKITSDKVVDYKEVLDKMNAVVRFYKMFYLYDGTKKLEVSDRNEYFYNSFEPLYREMQGISKDYDKIRNFATSKPNNEEKIKLNFDAPTLLAGWDKNKEKDNLSILLVQNGKYYLGVMDGENKKCFDFENQDVMKKAGQAGEKYQKMEYKQIAWNGFFTRCSGTAKKLGWNCPEECKDKDGKLIQSDAEAESNLVKIIDCYKDFLNIYEKDGFKYRDYGFKFLPSNQYRKLSEFRADATRQSYKIVFRDVSAKYIDELVEQGKLYLFQIYNKDFSENKKQKGTDNLHTLYWKALFSPENMNNTDGPIIKLNGEAEIFWRKASIEKKITHPKNQAIGNKNPLNSKKESVFTYDLIKNKRFTEDKFMFHCPITLNFRSSNGEYGYNEKVNRYVAGNTDIHIIGIDRGERHLLYYTVIDLDGNIKEQGSLNTIVSQYRTGSRTETNQVNYHDLLDKKEQERKDARLAWTAIENIKEIKSGYLSQVVHKLALLVEKYNAVIVLENLNMGFKRGRVKVEKQVYQNFEKALIQKFNYLVFKNRSYDANGSFAKGYQLTAPFEGFNKLGRQTGILYYVDPSYTSHICPKTGFVNYINSYLKYTNVAAAKLTLAKFDAFRFNNDKGYFEFVIDYDKFINSKISLEKWTICTVGDERYSYDSRTQTTTKYNVTEELKNLLAKYNVAYEDGQDLLAKIKDIDEKGFYSTLLYWLRLTMQLRYTVKGTGDEDDYILSPVADKNGNFFDSRNAQDNEPKNADANGAYHIALKGLQTIEGIKDGKLAELKKGEGTATWFKFVRERNS